MTDDPDTTTVTIAEAAAVLDTTRHAVRRLVRFGSLRAVDVAGHPRIERDELDAFIARQGRRLATPFDLAPSMSEAFSSNKITLITHERESK